MSYTIIRTNGSTLTTIPDGVVNTTSTPLSLPGRNFASYGQIVDTNFVRALENFADTAPPSNAMKGQLWYNTTPLNEGLYICPTDGETNPNNWVLVLTPDNLGNISVDSVTAIDDITANNAIITNNANANVVTTNYLTVNVQANIANANITGNAVAANLQTANITTGANTTAGNLTGAWALNGTLTSNGNITTAGIRTSNYFYANGVAVSFDGTYTNSNVAAYLPTYTGNVGADGSSTIFNGRTLSTGANVTTGTITGNWTLSAGSQINGLAGIAGANVTGTVANATFATSAGTATSATTAATVTTNAQPNITSTGTLTGLDVSGNANFTGQLISLGSNGNVRINGGLSGQVLSTNGSGGLSWVSAAAADTAITVTASAQPNITSTGTLTSLAVTGNITAGNVTATRFTGTLIGAANTAGTVTTAAQSNITSVGTLTGLAVSGAAAFSSTVALGSNANVSITGGSSGQVLATDGAGNLSWVPTGTATTAATVTTNAQPNITSVGTLTSLAVTGNITAGNVTATRFTGTLFGAANTAATVTTAAQPNITSVGALTGLSVTGNTSLTGANVSLGSNANVRITGGAAGQVLSTDGSGSLSWTSAAAADTAITVTANAQPNITSTGTLIGLAVSGNASFSGANVSLGSVSNVRIAGGTTGQILASLGSGAITWQDPAATTVIPAGTKMLFIQSTAPSGWVKDTSVDNAALRVVSGSAGSGGSVNFTSAFTSQAVSGTIGNTTAGGTISDTTISASIGNTAVSGTINPTTAGGTVGTTTITAGISNTAISGSVGSTTISGSIGSTTIDAGIANTAISGSIGTTTVSGSIGTTSITLGIGSTSVSGVVGLTTAGGTVGGTALSTSQMPSHTHGVTDPGHVHGVNDPGHSHTYDQYFIKAVGDDNNNFLPFNATFQQGTSIATTGITIDGATTGITLSSTGSGDTHSHSFTGTAHNHTFSSPEHTHALTQTGHSHTFASSPHDHTFSSPSHSHGFNQTAHNHTFSSPSHTHTFSSPEHTHTFTQSAHTHSFTGTAHDHTFSSPEHTHAFSQSAHGHSFSGTAHNHAFSGTAINLAVKYVDAIIATKS